MRGSQHASIAWIERERQPAPYRLPEIPYLRLRCTLRSLGPAVLPRFKGSLLRGAFGHALRRLVCVMGPAEPCASCRLRPACACAQVFETTAEGELPPFFGGLATTPRPFVFEPHTEARSFATGDELGFDLLLFGRAMSYLPYVLLAVERLATGGLGARRWPFALARVEEERGIAPARPSSGDAGAQGCGATRVVVTFLTPTRIKVHGRLAGEVSFRVLAFSMLRRALELAHFHTREPVDWDLDPLLGQAGEVRIAAAHLRWIDQVRYSNRQKTPMTLGGFVGRLEVEGDVEPFVPLLRMTEVLHVGKGTTFGLGRIAVEIAVDGGSPGAGARRGPIPCKL